MNQLHHFKPTITDGTGKLVSNVIKLCRMEQSIRMELLSFSYGKDRAKDNRKLTKVEIESHYSSLSLLDKKDRTRITKDIVLRANQYSTNRPAFLLDRAKLERKHSKVLDTLNANETKLHTN